MTGAKVLISGFAHPIMPPSVQPAGKRMRGDVVPAQKYDLAGTGASDRNHWKQADSLGPNLQNSPGVLCHLRVRSRYETANNGYVLGLVRGRGNECIGTGPRLQLTFPDDYTDPDFQRTASVPPGVAKAVEDKWREWCDAVGLTDKLHVLNRSESREGEVFGVPDTNPNAEPGTPQLDLRIYEADQCDTPWGTTEPNIYSGIKVDGSGRPVAYYLLHQHPGDATSLNTSTFLGDWVPARDVFHLFDPDRAGQVHGIPTLTAGIPLGAVMRRYTMAALGSAELQASIPATIESDYILPDADDASGQDALTVGEQIPFAHTVMMTLPGGYKAKPFPQTQPAPGYREFKAEVNTEMGRGMNAPRNVSTGSSAEYNYSSGRLDHLPWQTACKIWRDRCRRVLLDRLFRIWYAEAILIPGYLPAGLPPLSVWRWCWRWDAFASIDPVKDATANQIRLTSGQTTLDDVCAEQGRDWEEVLEQQAREMKKRAELGLPQLGAAPAPVGQPAAQPANDTADATGDNANA